MDPELTRSGHEPREAEVAELDDAELWHEDVLGLDVAVDDLQKTLPEVNSGKVLWIAILEFLCVKIRVQVSRSELSSNFRVTFSRSELSRTFSKITNYVVVTI
jgi:hypothetical protein